MNLESTLIVIAAGFCAYPILLFVLAKWAQPMRLELAEIGGALEVDSYLDARQKSIVGEMLNSAYAWWVMILFAAVTPVLGVRALIDCFRGTKRPTRVSGNDETEADYDRFLLRFIGSTMAANPIFGALFCVEILVVSLVILIAERQVEAIRTFVQGLLQSEMMVFDRATAFAR